MQKPPNSFQQDIFLAESIPAGPKQRYLAMTIDSLLIAILAGFFASVKGIKDPKLLMQVNAFVTVIYYTLLQWQFGYTLGKKVMKLQLVSVDGSKLSFMNVLLRETLGRLVSISVFFLGFVWIFCNKQRRGWHDLMSRTQVVSVDPMAEVPSRGAWIKFAASTGIMIAISGGLLYGMFFTSYPIKKFAQNLELAGFQVVNPHGSIARGMKIDRLSISGTDRDFALENVTLKLGLIDLAKNKFVVKQLSVNGGELHLPDVFNPLLIGALVFAPAMPKLPPEQEAAPEDQTTPAPQNKRNFSEYIFKKVDLTNMIVHFGETKRVVVDRLLIDNLSLVKKDVTVDRIWLQSDAVDLDLGGIAINSEQISSARLKGLVKQSILKDYLAKDLDFEGGFGFDLETRSFTQLGLGLCERRLQLTGQKQAFRVQTYDLTPSKCLLVQVPITRLNLQMKIEAPRFIPNVQKATVMVRNVPFTYMPNYGFVSQRGAKSFAFQIGGYAIGQLIGGKTPTLQILSSETDDREWLSDLYFDKSTAQLSETEAQIVDVDMNIFRSPSASLESGDRLPAGLPSESTSDETSN